MAYRYTFIIDQGATKYLEILYADSEGVPIDLSPYTARMQLRPAPGSSTLYATLTTANLVSGSGIFLTGYPSGSKPHTSGAIGVVFGAELTTTFTFNEASYDLELVSGSYVDRVIEGKIKIDPEVTTNV